MTMNSRVTCLYLCVVSFVTEESFANYCGILMCKYKCCKIKTCDHIYYSSEKLSCHVQKDSSRKVETLKCKQISCDTKDRMKESLSHQQNGSCICLILLPSGQSSSNLPDVTIPEALQDGNTRHETIPVDVKNVICQPRVKHVPLRFDHRSVHESCSLVDGVLEIKKPSATRTQREITFQRNKTRRRERIIRKRRESWAERARRGERNSQRVRSRSRRHLKRIKGASSYQEFSSKRTGCQWFGVKVHTGILLWDQSLMSVLGLFFCKPWLIDIKSNLEENLWCIGFNVMLSKGMLRVTSKCPGSGHQDQTVEEIEMKDSMVFAVIIRIEQPELVLLDLVEKRILGKCDSFETSVSKFVVQLSDVFPVRVQFKSLHTEDIC